MERRGAPGVRAALGRVSVVGGTLLRGGSILTLDPVLGDIEGGDLLIGGR